MKQVENKEKILKLLKYFKQVEVARYLASSDFPNYTIRYIQKRLIEGTFTRNTAWNKYLFNRANQFLKEKKELANLNPTVILIAPNRSDYFKLEHIKITLEKNGIFVIAPQLTSMNKNLIESNTNYFLQLFPIMVIAGKTYKISDIRISNNKNIKKFMYKEDIIPKLIDEAFDFKYAKRNN